MHIGGFFKELTKYAAIDHLGDPLKELNSMVEWEIFLPTLLEAVRPTQAKGPGGRPPYNPLLLFKILILQRLYNLSDEQAEYQINDRLSFMRFLELDMCDKVPDAKTIWLFRETLTKAGTADELFIVFRQYLEEQGVITHTGSIVDASFVDRRKNIMSKQQYEQIKKGEVPETWQGEGNVNKRRQTDFEARSSRKYRKKHIGYKMHNKVDDESKCIVDVIVTPANVGDSKVINQLLNETDQVVYADKGYIGKKIAKKFPKNVVNQIHERASRNHPLSEEAKERNRVRSKKRGRVEHVFATMKYNMKCGVLRCVGLARAKMQICMLCLVYNMKRFAFLNRPQPC